MSTPIRVTVWNEFWHENPKRHADVKSHLMNYGFSGERLLHATEGVHRVYPDGMHAVIADHLSGQGFAVRAATLDEPEHGLTQAVLDQTDVLTWWGHVAHDMVSDEIVERVHERVNMGGMGLGCPALRALFKDIQEVDGHLLHVEDARSGRERTYLGA